MNIEFDCPACGKHYSVKPGAAGKRGPCKGCGKPITIPDAPDDSLYGIADDAPGPAEGSAVESLAPLGRKRAPAVRESASQPKGKKRDKKSDGLYETLWGSESIWGGPNCTTLNKVVRGVAGIGLGCVVAVAAVLMARAGRASRADVVNLARAEVESMNSLTQIFQSADDAASAGSAAGRAVPVIKAWTKRVRDAARKRARNDDMEEVLSESLDPIKSAANAMWKEVGRIQSIPGADPAVTSALKPAFDELLAIAPREQPPDGPLKHSTPVILPVPTRDAPAALQLSAPPHSP